MDGLGPARGYQEYIYILGRWVTHMTEIEKIADVHLFYPDPAPCSRHLFICIPGHAALMRAMTALVIQAQYIHKKSGRFYEVKCG